MKLKLLVLGGIAVHTLGYAQQVQMLQTKAFPDGAVQLNWNSDPNSLYQVQFTTQISENPNWQLLADSIPSHGGTTSFLDTGRYNQSPVVLHPRYDFQRYYKVTKISSGTLTPPVLAVSAQSVASGDLPISVTVSSSSPLAYVRLFVDGEEVDAACPEGNNATFSINTTEWPNGDHKIVAVGESESGGETTPSTATDAYAVGASAPVTVVFDNYISQWSFSQPLFDPDAGQIQTISAKFASYSSWVLRIVDQFNATVRTQTGVGYEMCFDWNGTGTGNTPLPNGEYDFQLSATKTTEPLPPPVGNPGPPPNPNGATLQLGANTFSDNSVTITVPMPPAPPGFPEIPVVTITHTIPTKASSALTVQTVGAQFLAANSSSSSGGSTSNPRRPPSRKVKGVPGTIGVAYQGHHPDQQISSFKNPANLVGRVTLTPVYPLPYGTLANASKIATGFEQRMNRNGWKTGLRAGNDQLTASMLRKPAKGGTSAFNNVNIGLLIGHGIRGGSQDLVASSTPSLQTYYPIYRNGATDYDWVRMSEMSFGGNLRWMGLYACNLFYPANVTDMYNKGVLPISPQCHIICAAETSVMMYPSFGYIWANGMLGGETGSPMEVILAWNRAAQKVHAAVRPSFNVAMCSVFWPDCQHDKLLSYSINGSNDPSELLFSRVTVYQP